MAIIFVAAVSDIEAVERYLSEFGEGVDPFPFFLLELTSLSISAGKVLDQGSSVCYRL